MNVGDIRAASDTTRVGGAVDDVRIRERRRRLARQNLSAFAVELHPGATAGVPDPATRRPARYTGTHRRRRSTEPVWEGIAPDGRRADDDTLTPEAVAYLAALHRDLPESEPEPEPEPREPVTPAVPDTDEWWRHTFAAARIRDRLAVARVGADLPAEFRALVDAAGPVVEARRREVEQQFHILVDSLSGEHPILTPAGAR